MAKSPVSVKSTPIGDEGHTLHLALKGNHPAGTIVTRPTLDGVRVSDFYVFPGFRQKGVGESLIDTIKKRHKGQTLTLRARSFGDKIKLKDLKKIYSKLGFTEESAGEDRWVMKAAELSSEIGRKVDRPYRERAELIGKIKGKVPVIQYPHGGIGFYGGGVDAGEDPLEAARREFFEESGLKAENIRPSGVKPTTLEWTKEMQEENPALAEKAKKWRGSRSHYFLGDIPSKRRAHTEDLDASAHTLSQLKWMRVRRALRKLREEEGVDDARAVARSQFQPVNEARIAALDALRKGAEEGPTPEMKKWYEKRQEEHLARVRKYCKKIHDYDPKRFSSLIQRGKDHDKSKEGRIEHDPYIYIAWRYKCENEGEEFECPSGMKTKMHEATVHHVNNNRHHPEYFGRDEKVVNKRERHNPTSTLVNAYKMGDEDLAEMVADWCSVSEEMGNSPRSWFKKTCEPGDGQRWLFSEEQKDLIKELIDAAWGNEKKASADFAPGLPDPRRFGDVTRMPTSKEMKFVIQRHLARRAGPHYDVRMGTPETGLYSWATKKEWPEPGKKIMLFQQPVHKYEYGDFQGKIPEGYGAGVVKTHDKGAILVRSATKDKIKFVVAHRGTPEYYTMVRRSGPSGGKQGGSWLLINTTPVNMQKWMGKTPKETAKARYKSIPADQVEKLFTQGNIIQNKIDGASMLYRLFENHIEATSYRTSKTGRPIVHTERLFGPGGAKVRIPKEHVGTVLRGEAYGVRGGEAIPVQELGGILNASAIKSLEKQRAQNVTMKSMLFNTVGDENLTHEERMAKLDKLMKFLPKQHFHLPESARTPAEQRKLWERVRSGSHPLTREGIVAWTGARAPTKVKLYPENDVWVKGVFPGEGKLKGTGAGGFEYSLSPEGKVVGRVGTGFSDETRRAMLADPDKWIGRMARIRAQEKFPSGAYRAPSFLALHEDYPTKVAHTKDATRFRRVLQAMKPLEVRELLYKLDLPVGLQDRLISGVRRRGPVTAEKFFPERALEEIPGYLRDPKFVSELSQHVSKTYPGLHFIEHVGRGAESTVYRVKPTRALAKEFGTTSPVVLKVGTRPPTQPISRAMQKRTGRILPHWKLRTFTSSVPWKPKPVYTWFEPMTSAVPKKTVGLRSRNMFVNPAQFRVEKAIRGAGFEPYDMYPQQLGRWGREGKVYLIDRGSMQRDFSPKTASLIDEIKGRTKRAQAEAPKKEHSYLGGMAAGAGIALGTHRLADIALSRAIRGRVGKNFYANMARVGFDDALKGVASPAGLMATAGVGVAPAASGALDYSIGKMIGDRVRSSNPNLVKAYLANREAAWPVMSDLVSRIADKTGVSSVSKKIISTGLVTPEAVARTAEKQIKSPLIQHFVRAAVGPKPSKALSLVQRMSLPGVQKAITKRPWIRGLSAVAAGAGVGAGTEAIIRKMKKKENRSSAPIVGGAIGGAAAATLPALTLTLGLYRRPALIGAIKSRFVRQGMRAAKGRTPSLASRIGTLWDPAARESFMAGEDIQRLTGLLDKLSPVPGVSKARKQVGKLRGVVAQRSRKPLSQAVREDFSRKPKAASLISEIKGRVAHGN